VDPVQYWYFKTSLTHLLCPHFLFFCCPFCCSLLAHFLTG
jgi:hypothetical protein